MKLSFRPIGNGITLMFLVLASMSVSPSKAQTAEVSVSTTAESKPELQVKFLGSSGEYLYFELSMLQAEDLRSNLRIRNENGNELYSETVFRKSATRKLKIAKDEAEKIEFIYSNHRGEIKKLFEIKIKMQEAIEVKDVTRL